MTFNLQVTRKDTEGNEFVQKLETPVECLNLNKLPDDATFYEILDAFDLAASVLHGILDEIETEDTPTPAEAKLMKMGLTLAAAKVDIDQERRCRELITQIMPGLSELFGGNKKVAREARDGITDYLMMECGAHIAK